jgi:hypothetical protein
MDDATRAEFLARIKRDVSALTRHDRELLDQVMPVILSLTSDPRLGPVTLLTPDEQAAERIDVDDGRSVLSCARGSWACCSTK